MLANIHKEMAYQILADHPTRTPLEFLLTGIAKPEWKKNIQTKIKWLKEWMDMPDNRKHSSKQKNDHSYKLFRTENGFRIAFAKTGADQATVVARLKYSARSIREWKIEEEYRTCALELAKSIHWIIDMGTPPHTTVGWDDEEHAKIESDFDRLWKTIYDKKKIKFGRKKIIKDIYRWAKKNIEDRYNENMRLLKIYKEGGSIKDKENRKIAEGVISNISQNLADYIAYIDKYIRFDAVLSKMTG
jgi:hypothetical protein